MKSLIYIDLSSFQNHRISNSSIFAHEVARQTKLFQKYFPKYLKTISFPSKKGSIISKIKRTKVIQKFEPSASLLRPKSWRLLLANKQKTIRSLQNSNTELYQFPEKIRFLPNLHSLHIIMPTPLIRTSTEPNEKLDFYLKKSCRMMNRLRNLQCLKISQLSTNHKNFLIFLNKSQRFLSSLEKFSLCWNEDMLPSSNYNLLYAMPIHKNLSKYVTSLDLGNLCIPAHFFNFQYLADTVPQLIRLAFRYDPPKVYSKDVGNFFEALKKFQNLKSLDIKIADLFMFIKGFVTSPGVQNLKFTFEECFSKEIMQKFDRNFIDGDEPKIFQENETISRLCKNFQAISSLKSLEIIWKYSSKNNSGNSEKYQSCFSQSLITGIASLENLTYTMSASKPWKKENFDLLPLLESCLGSSQTLTSLEIGSEYSHFSQCDLSGLEKKFTRLSSLRVIGEFLQENDVYLLLKQLVLLGDSLQKIKLQALLGEDTGPIAPLFQQINPLETSSQTNVEVQIRFEDDLKQEDIEGLIKLIKESQKEYSREGIYFKILTPFIDDTLLTNLKKRLRFVCQEKFKNCEIIDSEDYFY